jgi:hypothetical protein
MWMAVQNSESKQRSGKARRAPINHSKICGWKVLERIADPVGQLAESVADVQPIVILLFSQMIGALVLQIAGRLDQLQTDPLSLLRILLGS